MPIVYAHLRDAIELVLPEVALLATVCVMLFGSAFLVSDRGEAQAGLRHRWGWLALTGLSVALYLWWYSTPQPLDLGPFRCDELTWYVRGLNLAAGLILVLLNWNQADDSRAGENQAFLLTILAGVNFVAAANDLTSLFLALELISIPTYLFLLMPRRDVPAQEATIKYFLLSVFSSAVLLFGLSYFYGATGTTNLVAIDAAFKSGTAERLPTILGIAAVMMIAGLAFRLTAVPFHFYAPDVFQGAPNSAAAMLSFIPKLAGFVALYRLLGVAFSSDVMSLANVSQPLLWWLAVLTMCLGNGLALLQTDVRRMLAYSSVSHAGYMLIGFVTGLNSTATLNGFDALLFYLAVYAAMTLGAFAVLAALSTPERRVSSLQDLAGLSRVRPGLALVLTLFLFSLTGLPPTAGFIGKLQLFLAAWNSGTVDGQWLAILLTLNAAVGAAYYFRVIREMYFSDPIREWDAAPQPAALVALGLCSAATLGLFFVPGVLWQIIQKI